MRKSFNVTPGVYVETKIIQSNENQSNFNSGLISPGIIRVNDFNNNKKNTYLGDESFGDYILLEDGNMIELE